MGVYKVTFSRGDVRGTSVRIFRNIGEYQRRRIFSGSLRGNGWGLIESALIL